MSRCFAATKFWQYLLLKTEESRRVMEPFLACVDINVQGRRKHRVVKKGHDTCYCIHQPCYCIHQTCHCIQKHNSVRTGDLIDEKKFYIDVKTSPKTIIGVRFFKEREECAI